MIMLIAPRYLLLNGRRRELTLCSGRGSSCYTYVSQQHHVEDLYRRVCPFFARPLIRLWHDYCINIGSKGASVLNPKLTLAVAVAINIAAYARSSLPRQSCS